jgi:lipoate-protein ligase A
MHYSCFNQESLVNLSYKLKEGDTMITILNDKTDPRYNLALEEYVLKHLPIEDDIILLWQNEPSIIIGRNQNTIEEINSSFVKEHNIHVVRRISGGGAVYHDFGNLNFTFITNNYRDNLNNYRKFANPVIEVLKSLGVPAEFSGRNDIIVDGKKISGNAQSYHKNRMFQHGTILFDADLDMVSYVLKVHLDKIESKGIKSNRSRVTNILPYIKSQMNIKEFQEYLLHYFLNTEDVESKTYQLTEDDYKNIQKLMEDKYSTWDWNYGESPQFEVQKGSRFLGGRISFHLNVKDGLIKECKIYGDFLGKKDIHELELLLVGLSYREEVIRDVLASLSLEEFFYNITIDDLINCLFY